MHTMAICTLNFAAALALGTILMMGNARATPNPPPWKTPSAVTRQIQYPAAAIPHQIAAWNFDLDDNILRLPTPIVIFNKQTGDELLVSTHEFAAHRTSIGKPGTPFEHFEVRPNDPVHGSMRFFRDASGTNFFRYHLSQALKNPNPKSWQGPSFKAFISALSSRSNAMWVSIITMRGHSPEFMLEGLQLLKHRLAEEEITIYLPPKENLYGVNHPSLLPIANTPSDAKAVIMMRQLDWINAQSTQHIDHFVRSSSGEVYSKLHLYGFSDDDWGNIKTALATLGPEVAKGRWPNVKIVIYYTGPDSRKELPAPVVVITPSGSIRPIFEDEKREFYTRAFQLTLCEAELQGASHFSD